MPASEPMTLTSILETWDTDRVELTLTTGEKVSGVIAMFGTGPLVAVGVDTPSETIYQLSAVIGARWISED